MQRRGPGQIPERRLGEWKGPQRRAVVSGSTQGSASRRREATPEAAERSGKVGICLWGLAPRKSCWQCRGQLREAGPLEGKLEQLKEEQKARKWAGRMQIRF